MEPCSIGKSLEEEEAICQKAAHTNGRGDLCVKLMSQVISEKFEMKKYVYGAKQPKLMLFRNTGQDGIIWYAINKAITSCNPRNYRLNRYHTNRKP